MLNLPSKSEIINAIAARKSGYQSNQLTFSNELQGYARVLINIIDQEPLEIPIKHKILLQLNALIRTSWISRRGREISQQEKQSVKHMIIESFLKCPFETSINKTFKSIITTIVGYEYRLWNPVAFVLEKIKKQQSLPNCLQLLLAIICAFQFSINEEELSYFYKILGEIFPNLLKIINNYQSLQITYLCIKFLWKAVHYQISPTVKVLTLEWMPTLQRVVGSTHSLYDDHADKVQEKQSEAFFYFHSKKWATRILLRFVKKHAKKALNRHQDNRQFSEKWYAEHGDRLIDVLVGQFAVGTTMKVRYFQLKCVSVLIDERRQKMAEFSDFFQYKVLPNHLRLSSEDEELALREPTTFIRNQNRIDYIFSQLKLLARDVWLKFSEIGCEFSKYKNSYQPSPRLFENIQFINKRLSNSDESQIKILLFLLASLGEIAQKCSQNDEITLQNLWENLIPLFKNQNIFIKSRILEVFQKWSFLNLKKSILEYVFKHIYQNLNSKSDVVRLKALAAFSSMIQNESFKLLSLPFLKQITFIAFELIETNPNIRSFLDLQNILKRNLEYIKAYALQIMENLSRLFFQSESQSRKISQSDSNDDPQFKDSALKSLQIIILILDSLLDSETISKIQPSIMTIIQLAFGLQQYNFFTQATLLLRTFLFKVNAIKQQFWNFYQITIYYVLRVPPNKWPKGFCQNKNKSFEFNDYLEQENKLLVDFYKTSLKFIDQVYLTAPDLSVYENQKNRLIPLLFYFINEAYRIQISKYDQDQISYSKKTIIMCTSLMISILESFSNSLPKTIYIQIWEYSRMNLKIFRSQQIKRINSQLIGLLLWVNSLSILIIAQKQNMIECLVNEMCQQSNNLQRQRARLILGLNQLLLLKQKSQILLSTIPRLFKAHLKLISLSIQRRFKGHEDEQESYFDYDLDQDFFYLSGRLKHKRTSIETIDLIWEFQGILQKLSIEQSDFYRFLVISVREGQVENLRQQIRSTPRKHQ